MSGYLRILRSKKAAGSVRVLLLFALVALLAPLLSNNKPLYAVYHDEHLFPAFNPSGALPVTDRIVHTERIPYSQINWKQLDVSFALWPPCAYAPGESDLLNAGYLSPFDGQRFLNREGLPVKMPLRFHHWLGTGRRGNDVLAGVIHGARVSLTVGLLSVLLGGLLGLFTGAAAGYLGNNRLRIQAHKLPALCAGALAGLFSGFVSRKFILSDAFHNHWLLFSGELLLSCILAAAPVFVVYGLLKALPLRSRMISIPADTVLSGFIKVFTAVPKIILVICAAALFEPSVAVVTVTIGCAVWPSIARITRGEFMKASVSEYVQASRALGNTHFRIIFWHILPNCLSPLLSALILSVSTAILAEASLSFLGIGVPGDVTTWGSLISSAREQINAWWLILFPSAAVFLLVHTLYRLADKLQEQ
jgi:peptide/nickel transport system permease protein